MIENINTILIYIFFILLLFCIMYLFIYSDQKISFYDNLDSIENSIKNDMYKDHFKNTSLPTLPSIYSNIDGEAYYQALSDFNNYIVDTRNNLGSIITTINNAEFKTAANNKLLTDNIKHLYFKEYLQYTNKVNANVYNESNDYLNPKKKKTQ